MAIPICRSTRPVPVRQLCEPSRLRLGYDCLYKVKQRLSCGIDCVKILEDVVNDIKTSINKDRWWSGLHRPLFSSSLLYSLSLESFEASILPRSDTLYTYTERPSFGALCCHLIRGSGGFGVNVASNVRSCSCIGTLQLFKSLLLEYMYCIA